MKKYPLIELLGVKILKGSFVGEKNSNTGFNDYAVLAADLERALEKEKKVQPAASADQQTYDSVNFPKHYNKHPSGIECIQITEHMSFTLGNVIKYVWRADLKNGVEDLEKAAWYLAREIEKRKRAGVKE